MPVKAFTRNASIQLTATTYTVKASETGRTFVQTLSSGTQTYTLPPIARNPAGLVYSFICGDVGGEINVSTASSADTIKAKATEDAGAAISSTTGIKNSGAGGTNVLGDHITLVSDGVAIWYMLGQSGTWAVQ